MSCLASCLTWIIIQNRYKLFLLLTNMLVGSCLCPDSLCCSANPIVPTHSGTGDCHKPASGNPLRLLNSVSKLLGRVCLLSAINAVGGRINIPVCSVWISNFMASCPQSIELVAVVRLMGSRLCCRVLRSSDYHNETGVTVIPYWRLICLQLH